MKFTIQHSIAIKLFIILNEISNIMLIGLFKTLMLHD